jgi:hypothetical protein
MQWLADWLTTPPPFSPLVLVILIGLTVLGTICSAAWLVLAREEPDGDGTAVLARITSRDESEADRVRRRLDAEAGRTPTGSAGRR